ncbi:MAG: kynureninase [Gemmataceae bacterium]
MNPHTLYTTPNSLAADYSRFRVAERLLLTGHSHQAWPDCCFEAQQQAWLDAAELVDNKWSAAFARADDVRRGYARWLDDPEGDIALGQNTHELLVRLLSALSWQTRPKIISTDGEFHTARRLFDRLAEAGLEVVKVPANPVDQLAPRISEVVDDRTALVYVSSVLFQTAQIVPGITEVARSCQHHGAELVIDTYHHLGVLPFSIRGLERAFLLGGGYKYLQLGEGNCALRIPPDCESRPITTGWFTEFDALANKHEPKKVLYGAGGSRFAGATYDPTSNYRGAAVFRFFEEKGLTPEVLREVSQHQVGVLAERFDSLDLPETFIRRDRNVDLSQIGGFLVLQSAHAGDICARLKQAGVMTDYRGENLRLGPAPYLSDSQLHDAFDELGTICRERVQT